MSVFIGEAIGTFFLVLLSCGTIASTKLEKSKGQNSGWPTVTIGLGIALMIGIFISKSLGSKYADLNPAISWARYLISNDYTFGNLLLIQLSQFIGAFLGGVFVWIAYLPHWKITEDVEKKLLVFSTVPSIREYKCNFINETLGTAVLTIGIGAISSSPAHNTGFEPYLMGMLIWGVIAALGGQTGAAINPARDLGPRIAHFILPIPNKGKSDWYYSWVPIFGPILGSTLDALLWKVLFIYNY